jgi:chaperonin GroES
MNFKPLSNNVLIEPIKEEQKTKSGIVLPETAEKSKQARGKVIAVGPGKFGERGERIPCSVKTGEVVLFEEPWSENNKIKDEGKEYFLVKEEEILAIIE